MNIRRNVGLFLIRYGKPILIAILIVGGIILITQLLNNREKEKSAMQAVQSVNTEVEIKVPIADNKQNQKLITEFIEYCNNGQIEQAYKMISSNCKLEKYKTIEEFKNKYYKKIFNIKQNHKIELQNDTTYKIIFTEDMLLSGSAGKNERIDYYNIIKERDGNKININIKNSI